MLKDTKESQMVYLESNTYITRPVLHSDILYVVVQLFVVVKAILAEVKAIQVGLLLLQVGLLFQQVGLLL